MSASNSPLATGYRLGQPVTPETVYCPTLAGRRSKPRNLILCLARAGSDPTTSSTVVQRLTVVPTRQAELAHAIRAVLVMLQVSLRLRCELRALRLWTFVHSFSLALTLRVVEASIVATSFFLCTSPQGS